MAFVAELMERKRKYLNIKARRSPLCATFLRSMVRRDEQEPCCRESGRTSAVVSPPEPPEHSQILQSRGVTAQSVEKSCCILGGLGRAVRQELDGILSSVFSAVSAQSAS